jgi:hypothetical protein
MFGFLEGCLAEYLAALIAKDETCPSVFGVRFL